jgi:hypothetical protein
MNAAVRDDAAHLNGCRFTPSKSSRTVYVILWGRACLVPDSHTYANLWDKTGGIAELPPMANIPAGNPLSSGAYLASGTSSDALYLVTKAIPQGPDLAGPS